MVKINLDCMLSTLFCEFVYSPDRLNINFWISERLQHERQQALEKMGISVQASGIKVEKNKYYLVNLNADPSLNELLVYYLKVSIRHL